MAPGGVGWLVLVLLLVLAMMGLFGTGALSSTSVSAAGGELEVDIQRFGRRTAAAQFQIHVASSLADAGEFQVDVDRKLAQELHIDKVTPTPDSVEVVGGALRYTLSRQDEGAPLEVLFSYRAQGLWKLDGTVSVPDGPSVDL